MGLVGGQRNGQRGEEAEIGIDIRQEGDSARKLVGGLENIKVWVGRAHRPALLLVRVWWIESHVPRWLASCLHRV